MDEEAAWVKPSRQAAARRTAEKGKAVARVPITRQQAALEAEAAKEAADFKQAQQASLESEKERRAKLHRSLTGEGSSKDAMNDSGADALSLMPPIPAAPDTALCPAPAQPAAATATEAAKEAAASTAPAPGGLQAAAAAAAALGSEAHALGMLHIAVYHHQ